MKFTLNAEALARKSATSLDQEYAPQCARKVVSANQDTPASMESVCLKTFAPESLAKKWNVMIPKCTRNAVGGVMKSVGVIGNRQSVIQGATVNLGSSESAESVSVDQNVKGAKKGQTRYTNPLVIDTRKSATVSQVESPNRDASALKITAA